MGKETEGMRSRSFCQLCLGLFLIVRLAEVYHCEKISLELELNPVAALVFFFSFLALRKTRGLQQ